jgi:hypothetical protein
LNRRLGESQSRSGRGGEEKNSQPLPGFEPPIIQPVAQRYTTELRRLSGVNLTFLIAIIIIIIIIITTTTTTTTTTIIIQSGLVYIYDALFQ